MAPLETVRSFVNTWQCDENAHMNIQFYFANFDIAGRQFAAQTGLDESRIGRRLVRHVRYHKEMRAGDLMLVTSAIVPDGPHPLTVVHQMHDPVGGTLAATALDGFAVPVELAGLPAMAMPEAALPRSFDAAPHAHPVTSEALLAAGGCLTFRGAVHPGNGDATGAALDQTYIACVSDGAAHAWEHGAMSGRWLAEQGFGRVALEMKLSLVSGLAAGDLMHMVTIFTSVTRKVFTFTHHLFETKTDRLAATIEAAGVAMDLSTRRAVELPPFVHDRVAALVAAGKDV